MPSPPWVQKPNSEVPYVAEHITMKASDWDRFGGYYTQKRQELLTAMSDVLATARLPLFNLEATTVMKLIEDERGPNDLSGQIGEILSSFLLEDTYGVLLFALSWPDAPFSVRRGTDISGVCLTEWSLVCVESKATRNKSPASQASKAREGMMSERMWQRFRLPVNDGQSRRAAVVAVRRAIRRKSHKSLQRISPSDVEKLLSDNHFVRVGSVIHEARPKKYSYKSHLDALQKNDVSANPGPATQKPVLPTVFVDVGISFEDALRAFGYLEMTLRGE